jgi:hypothetical protein
MSQGYKYWNGERWVGGTAAYSHLVWSVYDGPEDYERRIAEKAIEITLKELREINEINLKRSQFKLID